MFSRFFQRLLRISAPLLVLCGVSLHAQLNPKYQTSGTPTTDFLDIFQSTSYTSIKPEIVTLFDFSGSMNQVMFHPSFPNWYGGNGSGVLQNNEDPSNNYDFVVTVGLSGANYVVTGVKMVSDNSQTTPVSSFKISTDTGAIKAPYANAFDVNATYTLTSPGVTDATKAPSGWALIKPDGTMVTQADALAASNAVTNTTGGLYGYKNSSDGYKDARNWVRCASHLRVGFSNGSTTRVVDIPVHWARVQPSSTGTPLVPMKVTDPKTSTVYDVDSTYLDAPSAYTTLGAWSNSTANSSLGATTAVASALVGSATNVHAWREDYLAWVFFGKDSVGNYVIPASVNGTTLNGAGVAFNNGMPNISRVQAVKEAAIKTWLKYQDQVVWAYRGLDPAEDTSGGNVDPSLSFTDSTNTVVPTSNSTSGGSRVWCLMNGNTDKAVKRLAKLAATTGTPLNEAVACTLAQMAVSGSTAFKSVETGTNAPSDCLKHFLIVFTDGSPNSTYHNASGVNEPYASGPSAGNTDIKSNLANTNTGGNRWNVPTLAGIAAWGANASQTPIYAPASIPAYPATASTLSSFIPFWIKSRVDGGTGKTFTFPTPHPIKVMTAGVSLGTGYNATTGVQLAVQSDALSPKYRLFAAALFGNPLQALPYNLSTAVPYYGAASDPNQAYFFDCQVPDTLVNYLDASFATAVTEQGTQAVSAPVTPLSGIALSDQVYLTNFQVPATAGPVWAGDLLMFTTKNTNGTIQLLSNSGAVLTDLTPSIAATSAQWSGNTLIATKGYTNRRIYSRPPATSAAPNPDLVPFQTSGSGWLAIKDAMTSTTTTTDAQKQALILWFQGQDPAVPANTRNPLMGDVVNSTPATMEYSLAYVNSSVALPATLATNVAAHVGDSSAHFRLVFVGTNLGFLHCFGELRWDTTDGAGNKTPHVVADELWAYLPTDFLPYLDKVKPPASGAHRLMVDGSPYCYLLDLAPSNKVASNGMFDGSPERAIVIFGLGKGGRSYYALNIADPMNPHVAWSLNPEESATIPGSRVKSGTLASTQTLVSNMGFSTSQISVGRVGWGGATPSLHDVIFLTGGLSEYEIEQTWFGGTLMGRNAFAMDAYTGDILQSWDFSTIAGIGSLNSGMVPYSVLANSQLVQRAYFTDMSGGLWALGSMQAGDGINSDFRVDYSQLDRWTVDGSTGSGMGLRHVYQGDAHEINGTLPAPFNVGGFPVARTTAPNVSPNTVGIALVSGDRNNPVDLLYTNTAPTLAKPRGIAPTNHRLTVVFDRQDSTLLGIEPINSSTLSDMSNQNMPGAAVITPGNASYYLNSKYGWIANFPSPSIAGYIPKGINPPTLISGVLFYTYFTPTSGGTCIPGSGNSYTFRVCDVMKPVISTSAVDPNASCLNGQVGQWSSVASNFSQRGTVAVTQAGTVIGTDPGTGNATNMATIQTMMGAKAQQFPLPRVWRTVH